jgi:ribosomal protein S18 acetylase RimI-like enzyme
MNYKMIPVSQLSARQTTELAGLHHKVLHSLLSELGLPIVERYYQIACKEPSVIGFCVLSAMGRPLGWVLGSSKPDQLNGRLREARLWFISQMLRVLFTHPRLMWQLFLSLRSAPVPMAKAAIELTYIGVDASARNQGLGRELLNRFVQAARDMKYRSVVLSVEAENTEAIALYTKAGFEIINSFTEGSFKRHRMELALL